ncbi:MAG TPA: ATP-binding protein [Polyangia bacterium]|nr:ATP-binding protein [Polyangia bacterium]
MRGVSLAILLVIAVATVLAFSLRSLQMERARLRLAFVAARDADVRDLASDLEDRLRDLEENARVIETLVDKLHSAPAADRDEQTRTLTASFKAMATVIRDYRTLVLLGPGGCHPLVVAVDPTEEPATGRALVQRSCGAAPTSPHVQRLTGPVDPPGGRAFYFYSFPVGADSVVVTIEGSLLLQSAFRSLPDSRIVVVDPNGAQWIGSGASTPFTVLPPERRVADAGRWAGPNGSTWLDAAAGPSLGLPAGAALAAWASANPGGLGLWRVVLLRSARNLESRERALVHQVVLTAAGLLLAIGLVGTLIVRQQRYSAALAERLRSAEALRSLERQLISAEKLATTGVLAAGIAHEVGTPLGIIRARAELLMDEIGRADNRRALEAIVQQIDRISSTIRQVLDFSRVQPVELGRVDLASAIPVALDLLGHRVRQQHIGVEVDVAPGLPPLAADRNQFQQVLINLLLNACDACARGGVIEIVASAPDGARRLCLDVRDNGTGIAPEHLLAVFDPFFTTKKRGEGTGLGLPIVASIVRNHGGEISLASAPGEGTTVTILWPAARDEEAAAHG